MVEKGKKNRNRREGQKTAKFTLKEKRKIKREKRSAGDLIQKIKKTGSQN